MKSRYSFIKQLKRRLRRLSCVSQETHYKAIHWIFNIECLFGLFLLCILYLPVLMGYQEVVVASASMAPVLSEGSLVLLEDPANVACGDIVAFHDGSHLICHRVVSINEAGMLITQGDANARADAKPVSLRDVVGRVRFCLPFLGKFLQKIENEKVLLLIGILILQVFLILFDKFLSRKRREKRLRRLTYA